MISGNCRCFGDVPALADGKLVPDHKAALALAEALGHFLTAENDDLPWNFFGNFRQAGVHNGCTYFHLPNKDNRLFCPKNVDASLAIFAACIAFSNRLIRSLLKYGCRALSRDIWF